jgi:hypothetical protein
MNKNVHRMQGYGCVLKAPTGRYGNKRLGNVTEGEGNTVGGKGGEGKLLEDRRIVFVARQTT